MVRKILPALLALASLALAGCGEFGKVEQGRVIAYDQEKKMVTFLKNNSDVNTPQYVLPAVTYAIPSDPAEMGPEPKAALRVLLDVNKKIIVMYNPQTKALEEIGFELIANHTGVNLRRQHPLVYDAATRRPRVFPQVDPATRIIKIYSARQQMLSEIKLSEADFVKYKEKEWDAGDEIRLYYHAAGKADRLMNITRTDITRRR